VAVPVFSPQNQTGSRKIREPQNIKSKTGFRLVETAFLSGYQHPQVLPMLLLLLLPQQHSKIRIHSQEPLSPQLPQPSLLPQQHNRSKIQMMFSFPQPNPHIIKYLLKIKAFLLHSYPMRYFEISCLSCFRFPAKKITSAESNH